MASRDIVRAQRAANAALAKAAQGKLDDILRAREALQALILLKPPKSDLLFRHLAELSMAAGDARAAAEYGESFRLALSRVPWPNAPNEAVEGLAQLAQAALSDTRWRRVSMPPAVLARLVALGNGDERNMGAVPATTAAEFAGELVKDKTLPPAQLLLAVAVAWAFAVHRAAPTFFLARVAVALGLIRTGRPGAAQPVLALAAQQAHRAALDAEALAKQAEEKEAAALKEGRGSSTVAAGDAAAAAAPTPRGAITSAAEARAAAVHAKASRAEIEQMRIVALLEDGKAAAAMKVGEKAIEMAGGETQASAALLSAVASAYALGGAEHPRALPLRRALCRQSLAEIEAARRATPPRELVGGEWPADIPVVVEGDDHIVLAMHDVYLEGKAPILYDARRVFGFRRDYVPDLLLEYTGGRGGVEAGSISNPALFFVATQPGNYYHWIVESMSRLAVARDWLREHPEVRLVLYEGMPSFCDEMVSLLGLDPDHSVRVPAAAGTRSHFDELFVVDVDLPHPLDVPSVWDLYVPPPKALEQLVSILATADLGDTHMVAREMRVRQAALVLDPPGTSPEAPAVVFVHRAQSPRRVASGQQLLLNGLKELCEKAGFRLLIATGQGPVAAQATVFRHARVLVGPHGAGLANLVFTPPGATVVEFAMDALGNRTYEYLAQVCKHRHVMPPRPTASYHGDYTLSAGDVDAVLQAVQTAL